MAQSHGKKNVDLVVVGDDVSVTRSKGNMVGRRCLSGVILGTWIPPRMGHADAGPN
jgi:dihydroxyacetone kinase